MYVFFPLSCYSPLLQQLSIQSHKCPDPAGVSFPAGKHAFSCPARRSVACATSVTPSPRPVAPQRLPMAVLGGRLCFSIAPSRAFAVKSVTDKGRGKDSTYFCPWQPWSYVRLQWIFAPAALVSHNIETLQTLERAIIEDLVMTPNPRNLLGCSSFYLCYKLYISFIF